MRNSKNLLGATCQNQRGQMEVGITELGRSDRIEVAN